MLQPPTKFEVRRRHTFGFNINQPGDRDLDLWTFDLEPDVRYFPWCGQQPKDFSVSGTFRSRHMGQQLSDGPRDFATLTFNLEGHGVVGNTGLRASSVYQVCST